MPELRCTWILLLARPKEQIVNVNMQIVSQASQEEVEHLVLDGLTRSEEAPGVRIDSGTKFTLFHHTTCGDDNNNVVIS